jgi:transketolase
LTRSDSLIAPAESVNMRQQISPNAIRRIILDESKRAHVGHIGSALSIADIIASLYSNVLNISNPDDPDRDRFVLSKGHAALALYAALALKGWIPKGQLSTYCGDNSLLGVHTEHILSTTLYKTCLMV